VLWRGENKGVCVGEGKGEQRVCVAEGKWRTRGYVWLMGEENKRVCVGEGRGEQEGMCG
jgi:hypothetical protein